MGGNTSHDQYSLLLSIFLLYEYYAQLEQADRW